jgi:signal peptidase I
MSPGATLLPSVRVTTSMRRSAISTHAPRLALCAALGALGFAGCGGSSPTASTSTVTVPAAVAAVGGAAGAHGGGASAVRTTTTTPAASGDPAGGAHSSAGGGANVGHGAAPGAPGSRGQSVTQHGASSGGRHRAAHHRAGAPAAGVGATAGSGAAAGSGTSGSPAPSAENGLPYEVRTTSMEPTYKAESTVYYDPSDTQPQIGQVVIFYLPVGGKEARCATVIAEGAACDDPVPGLTKELEIKRVVALPGDSLAIHDGHVYLNGNPEPEPKTIPCATVAGCEFPKPITIPPGHYFVLGDNRELPHEDSRVFGPIPQEAIVGVVEGS